jgi:hypothetical protein
VRLGSQSRCDEQAEASANGQQSGEGGDQRAVGPGRPWAWRTSSEHGELVAQDEDLDVLGGVGRMCSTIQLRSLENIW